MTPDNEPKPDYINKELKKVSEADLKKSLKEVNEKNDRDRRQMQQDTNKALSDGFRCGPAKPYNGDDDVYYMKDPDESVKAEPHKDLLEYEWEQGYKRAKEDFKNAIAGRDLTYFELLDLIDNLQTL